MVFVKLGNVALEGISSVVPTKELSLLDDPNLYNGNEQKIKRVVESSGFLKRRVADKTTTTADLCEQAANDLLGNLNVKRESIDGLLFISYTPDYLMPATSYVLHKKLNLSESCVVADIPQACSGFVFGLYQAGMMLNSGCKRVLLLVGDTFSKFTDMFRDHTAPVFGDAGTATLLEYDPTASSAYFNIKSDGNLHEALICKNGGFRNPVQKDMFYEDGNYCYESKMNGAQIFNFTLEKIAKSIEEVLQYANTPKEEIRTYVLHQANKFIIKNIALQLKLSEDLFPMSTLTKYGNQCGASIPCAVCDSLKEKFSSGAGKTLFSGFGVGLSWISAVIDLNPIYCSPVLEYKSL